MLSNRPSEGPTLTRLGKCKDLLPGRFTRAHVVYLLRRLGYDYTETKANEVWREWRDEALAAGVVRRVGGREFVFNEPA